MSLRPTLRAAVVCVTLGALVFTLACRNSAFGRQFEYEEEITLFLNGSIRVTVNASLAALNVLRGAGLDASRDARVDRDAIRAFYTCDGVAVLRVSRPWTRFERRFIQVRVEARDVKALEACRAFSWARYGVWQEQGQLRYWQRLGASASTVPFPGWTGQELVAVRIHVPSRITYHNAPSRDIERGNILTWEQPLRARIAGETFDVDVRMDERSILRRTLAVFVVSAVVALLVFASVIWWVVRRGRRRSAPPAPPAT